MHVTCNVSELDEFAKDILNLAMDTKGPIVKKFMSGEGKRLAKEEKSVFDSMGIGSGEVDSKAVSKSFKGGKPFNAGGTLNVRGYSSHPLAHLLNDGFIHRGGRDKTGKETFVPGWNFIDKATQNFESQYYDDTEAFIDKLINNNML